MGYVTRFLVEHRVSLFIQTPVAGNDKACWIKSVLALNPRHEKEDLNYSFKVNMSTAHADAISTP
jgi:hypothetical protein